MTGAISIYFDNETTKIVNEFAKEKGLMRAGKPEKSRAVRNIIKSFKRKEEHNVELMERNWDLKDQIKILEAELKALQENIIQVTPKL